ncbi:MAG: hypothetical protein XXXJIFNMEKO3_01665 [Candidatus Erwinia impunctatus]|nr:hypothetical protein XXXJIFNMEKO_01665 [Culicoides impunctatus]
MNAWTTLLTQPEYLIGVEALLTSLKKVQSRYPLVVLVTPSISEADRQQLISRGALLHEVTPLRPREGAEENYANARFAEVWSKLAVWQLTDYQRVVFLDADMLVINNMDELFDLALDEGQIAACHACRCNPERIASYPESWQPDNCFYSWCTGIEHTEQTDKVDNYLNGGLLVLKPDQQVYDDMVAKLHSYDDLKKFIFAEQDFLNEYYHQRWKPLPYIYNALKTLPFQHPDMWSLGDVKNLHFIIDKPWEKKPRPGERFYGLHNLWWDIVKN